MSHWGSLRSATPAQVGPEGGEIGVVIIPAWWLFLWEIGNRRIDRPPASCWQFIIIFYPVYMWLGNGMPQLRPTTLFERLTQTGASRASARMLEGADARPRAPSAGSGAIPRL